MLRLLWICFYLVTRGTSCCLDQTQADLIDSFGSTSRYLDDLLSIAEILLFIYFLIFFIYLFIYLFIYFL